MKYYIIGKVGKNGIFANSFYIAPILKNLQGKTVLIEVVEWDNRKTKAQLGYFWGCICKRLAEHFGCTIQQAHSILEEECASSFIETPNGVKIAPGRISEMNRKEMSEFIEKCIAYCAELGIDIERIDKYAEQYVENNLDTFIKEEDNEETIHNNG